jgi:hypothetical protein
MNNLQNSRFRRISGSDKSVGGFTYVLNTNTIESKANTYKLVLELALRIIVSLFH